MESGAKPREHFEFMPLDDKIKKRLAQQLERKQKLMEKVQRGIAQGQIRFNPELDFRIRQQLGRSQRQEGIER
jgi:hypothetical protein